MVRQREQQVKSAQETYDNYLANEKEWKKRVDNYNSWWNRYYHYYARQNTYWA